MAVSAARRWKPILSAYFQRHSTLVGCSILHVVNDGYVAAVYPLLPFIADPRDGFDLDYAQVAVVKSAISGVMSFAQLPTGLLAERVGERLVLGAGSAWLTLGFLSMGLAVGFWQLAVLAGVAGLGGSAQHPVASSLVSRAYEHSGRATAIGTLNFAGDVGKALMPLLGGMLVVAFGWRAAMVVMGLVGLPLVALFFVLQRAVGAAGPATGVGEPGQAAGGNGWGILHWPKFTALISVGVLDSAVRGSVLTLLPFLARAKGLDAPATGLLFTVIFVSGAIGKFGCGPLGDRFGSVAVIVATETVTAAAVLALLPSDAFWLFPLALAFGFVLNGTSSVLYATVADLVSAERRSRGYGLYYTFTLGSSALSPVLYGAVADRTDLATAFALAAGTAALTVPLAPLLRHTWMMRNIGANG